jgi:hypothetical protein
MIDASGPPLVVRNKPEHAASADPCTTGDNLSLLPNILLKVVRIKNRITTE